jgi:hypothetical protein
LDLGGVPDLLSVSAPGFSVCGTSSFCEYLSVPCGFSSVSALSCTFVQSLGEYFLVLEEGLLIVPAVPWANHFVRVSGRLEYWFAIRMVMSISYLTPPHRFWPL